MAFCRSAPVAALEFTLGIGLLALLADQIGTILRIGTAQRGIVVDTVFFQVVEREDRARPVVDHVHAVARGLVGGPVDRQIEGQDAERIDQVVDHQAGGVAGIGRSEARQHQIEAAVLGLDAGVEADRLACIFLRPLQAQLRGDVEQAGDADGRIHEEARHGGRGTVGIALEDLVDGRYRFTEIVEQVAHALLRRLWHPVAIDDRNGTQRDDIDDAVERKHDAVGGLDRIPYFVGTGIARCATAHKRSADSHRDKRMAGFTYHHSRQTLDHLRKPRGHPASPGGPGQNR